MYVSTSYRQSEKTWWRQLAIGWKLLAPGHLLMACARQSNQVWPIHVPRGRLHWWLSCFLAVDE
jgi:hypothetical protein